MPDWSSTVDADMGSSDSMEVVCRCTILVDTHIRGDHFSSRSDGLWQFSMSLLNIGEGFCM